MTQPLKKGARCRRAGPIRPSQGKLAGLGALVTEAVAGEAEVPEAAVAAEGARQGLRGRARTGARRERKLTSPTKETLARCLVNCGIRQWISLAQRVSVWAGSA